MKLVFVNIMHELYQLDSTATISQPPVPLAVLNAVTPKTIGTALVDEQTDKVQFDGDVFAFTLATQFAGKVYRYADDLRAAGKKVILGGIHVTVCPEESMRHADAIVTGEAETIWPTVCEDLLTGKLKERYTGSPTPSLRMVPVDYRFFGDRLYQTPASGTVTHQAAGRARTGDRPTAGSLPQSLPAVHGRQPPCGSGLRRRGARPAAPEETALRHHGDSRSVL